MPAMGFWSPGHAFLAVLVVLARVPLAQDSGGRRVLRVGPDETLRSPDEAASVAWDRDIVEIEAGTYQRGIVGIVNNTFSGRAGRLDVGAYEHVDH